MTLSLMIHREHRMPARTRHARATDGILRRFGRVALTMVAFAVVVTAIVTLKAWIWIPHP
jgi:hypothetical protein